jgi:hypothetical protein
MRERRGEGESKGRREHLKECRRGVSSATDGPRVAQQAVGEVRETGEGRRGRLERDVRSKSGSLPLRREGNRSKESSGRWQGSSEHKRVEWKDSLVTFFFSQDFSGERELLLASAIGLAGTFSCPLLFSDHR